MMNLKGDEGMKTKKLKPFIMTTMNGMVYGLFATLIIGVIFQQFGRIIGIELIEVTLFNALKSMTGIGIGMGIALSLKMDGLKMVVAAVMGGIATSFRMSFADGLVLQQNIDPVIAYLVVVLGILGLNLILRKRTPVDIILVPLVGALLAVILTLILSAPIGFMIDGIKVGIESATALAPIPMTIVIAVSLGILLTSPISSAAIAIAISLQGIAGGAAVIGTTTQMIGFAIQSRKDNNIGMVLSIAFGTSMLQFKNILRKPIIWLPTIIASAILAPLFYLVFQTETSRFGAGMGSSALVGQLQTLDWMNYSLSAWLAVAFMLVMPALLVYFIDLGFRKKKLILVGDLQVTRDIT